MIDTQQIDQRLKAAEARQRLIERYPIKRYNCRQPLTRGEEWIATLPVMVIQPAGYPYDSRINTRGCWWRASMPTPRVQYHTAAVPGKVCNFCGSPSGLESSTG